MTCAFLPFASSWEVTYSTTYSPSVSALTVRANDDLMHSFVLDCEGLLISICVMFYEIRVLNRLVLCVGFLRLCPCVSLLDGVDNWQ